MTADFVPRVCHHLDLVRERFDRMPWDEPRRTQVVPIEQFEQTRRPNLAREHAPRDVVGRVLTAVRPEPTGDRIDVYAYRTEDLFVGHGTCLPPFVFPFV
jgi:hypothetical protein